MKKIYRYIALLLVAVMLTAILVGCKKNEPAEADATTEPTDETSAANEPSGYGNNTVAALSN